MATKKLQVLFAAFEATPFVKTGGLGDVAGSLACGAEKPQLRGAGDPAQAPQHSRGISK